jgi:hypothetical protein
MSEDEKTKLSLESLRQPKVLIAAAIAAVGGLLYAGDGFTIEFSTCDTEEAEPVEEEAPEPEPTPEPEEETE